MRLVSLPRGGDRSYGCRRMLFFTRRAVACLDCGLGSKVVRLWKSLRAGLTRRDAGSRNRPIPVHESCHFESGIMAMATGLGRGHRGGSGQAARRGLSATLSGGRGGLTACGLAPSFAAREALADDGIRRVTCPSFFEEF